MHALLIGTGGAHGWPEDGCRCASCMTARQQGLHRRPGRVLIDGTLDFSPSQQVMTGTGQPGRASHRVTQLSGGFEITGSDGSRLLLAGGPGDVPEPPAGSAPYDIALLDLLASPAQLGRLRAAGLVREHTAVVAIYADHRVSSEQELNRRCAIWQAAPAQDGQLITSPGPGVPAVIPAPGTPPTRPHRTLIIGGPGSGRRAEAELRLAAEPQVTYLSTRAEPGPGLARDPFAGWPGPPPLWQRAKSTDLAGALTREPGGLLIDSVGGWLAAVLAEAGHRAGGPGAGGDPAAIVAARIDEMVAAWRHTRALVVAVTDRVETGPAPADHADRLFRDQLGWLNQRLVAESELNLLVIAGRVTSLPG